MGKINKKKFTKEIEQSENEDDFKSASENEQEETQSDKKRKANDSSDDEPLSPSKKSKKVTKKTPAKSSAKKEKSKKGATKSNDRNDDEDTDADANADAEENGEEEYEVKEIIDHKLEGGKSFYLVRWKGYTKDDDTWEPKDSLSCKDLIDKFEKKKAEASNDKSKKKTDKRSAKGKGKKDSPADPSKEWEVDKIIDYAEEKGVTLYRIRWKGYRANNDTWEPRDNLFCDDLIEKFEKRMKTLENVSFKELREEPKKTKRLVNETALRTDITNKIGRSSKRSATKKRVYYGDSDE